MMTVTGPHTPTLLISRSFSRPGAPRAGAAGPVNAKIKERETNGRIADI